MTSVILEAVKSCNVRAIISRGWSNLGEGLSSYTEDVLFINDCPHEWLFQHVAAVVHHGGAGTAANQDAYGYEEEKTAPTHKL